MFAPVANPAPHAAKHVAIRQKELPCQEAHW
jgi:hypothetical protein